jgi:predicted amidophosphoribosyltransferase
MSQILGIVGRGLNADIREIVVMARNVVQSHLQQERVSIPELIDSMRIDEACADPPPTTIGVFDDVLTTGRHFKAVQEVLQHRFQGVPIVGVFIARRVPEPTPELS